MTNDLKEFDHTPYAPELVRDYRDKLLEIQNKIHIALADSKRFDGITFYDRGSRGFQIKANIKEVKGYYYISSPYIDKGFSDIDSIVNSFVELWNTYDNDEDVESFKRFIRDGEKYGWD